MSAAADAECLVLRQWLDEDFGVRGSAMAKLCLAPLSKRPMYLSHLDIVAATLRSRELSAVEAETLTCAYVYLTAAFYSIDAQFDGHDGLDPAASNGLNASASALFVGAAVGRVATQLTCSISEKKRIVAAANRILLSLEQAMAEESEFSVRTRRYQEDIERHHMYARSGTILWLFDSVSTLNDGNLPSGLGGCIKDILVAIQFGDDIADWQEDMAADRWTPFLRICDQHRRSSETIDDHILLGGGLEAGLRDVVQRLAGSLTHFPAAGCDIGPLTGFVDTYIRKVEIELASYIDDKALALSDINAH